MEALRAFMSRRVAGIPVMFVVLVIAAVALYLALRLTPVPDDETDEEETPDAPSGDPADDSQPVFVANVPFQPSAPDTEISVPSEDTNEKWGRRAVEYLMTQNVSLETASNAIRKYLDGDQLTYQEGQARNKAVAQLGLPPEGVQPAMNPTGPPKYKGPASRQGVPPLDHVVRGTSDDTFAELALLYYQSKNPAHGTLIASRNPTLSGVITVGTKVRVPKLVQPRFYTATGAIRSAVAIARKNGIDETRLRMLNPGMAFPVRPKTRVRVR